MAPSHPTRVEVDVIITGFDMIAFWKMAGMLEKRQIVSEKRRNPSEL
jgi:hypothetical protein